MHESEIDLELLDQQHQRFMQLTTWLNDFIARARGGEYDAAELMRLVLRYRHYAFYHFYSEETYMIHVRFPEYFTHKDCHNDYLQKINSHLEQFERTYSTVNRGQADPARLLDLAEDLNAYVENWWQTHINTVDARYMAFSRKRAA